MPLPIKISSFARKNLPSSHLLSSPLLLTSFVSCGVSLSCSGEQLLKGADRNSIVSKDRKGGLCQHIPLILAFGKLRQEDLRLKASMGCVVSSSLA